MRKLILALGFAVSSLMALPASAITIINGPIPPLVPGIDVLASPDSLTDASPTATYTLSAVEAVLVENIGFVVQGIPNAAGLIPSLESVRADFFDPPTTALLVNPSEFEGVQQYGSFVIPKGGSVTFFVERTLVMGADLSTALSFTTAEVPLPATLPLLAAGVGGFVVLRRRAKAQAVS